MKKLYIQPQSGVEMITVSGVILSSPNPLPALPPGPSGMPAGGSIIE